MKTIFLKGELRDEVGTRTAKVLRAEGKVPCNMYGLADGNMNFAVPCRFQKFGIHTKRIQSKN